MASRKLLAQAGRNRSNSWLRSSKLGQPRVREGGISARGPVQEKGSDLKRDRILGMAFVVLGQDLAPVPSMLEHASWIGRFHPEVGIHVHIEQDAHMPGRNSLDGFVA